MSDFAIVVAAFQRPHSLERLLRSLEAAARNVSKRPTLVISVDGGAGAERDACVACAASLCWKGEKRVISHDRNLGLKAHILSCGDLTEQLGAVVLLEEDVGLSPMALRFAEGALERYGDSPGVAGVSLYSLIYNEFALRPFLPIDDGFDTYFAQTGSSWGAIWTPRQWSRFRTWLSRTNPQMSATLPPIGRAWPSASSWKKAFNAFLAETGGYVVFPRFSMTTNMGDAGAHAATPMTHLTSPLSLGRDRFAFADLDESRARYDPFLEIEPESLKAAAPFLRDFDFDIDLTGAKELETLTKPFTLTCRQSSKPDIFSFGLKHYPLELNVILQEAGGEIGLRVRNSLSAEPPADVTGRVKSFFRCPWDRDAEPPRQPRRGLFKRLSRGIFAQAGWRPRQRSNLRRAACEARPGSAECRIDRRRTAAAAMQPPRWVHWPRARQSEIIEYSQEPRIFARAASRKGGAAQDRAANDRVAKARCDEF